MHSLFLQIHRRGHCTVEWCVESSTRRIGTDPSQGQDELEKVGVLCKECRQCPPCTPLGCPPMSNPKVHKVGGGFFPRHQLILLNPLRDPLSSVIAHKRKPHFGRDASVRVIADAKQLCRGRPSEPKQLSSPVRLLDFNGTASADRIGNTKSEQDTIHVMVDGVHVGHRTISLPVVIFWISFLGVLVQCEVT